MCGKSAKSFVLLACFFLAFSSLPAQSLPPPAEMTDAQIIQELMDNLTKREASIKTQEQALILDRESLTREKEVLTQDRSILESRKALQTEIEAYWKNYKQGRLQDRLIDFAAGFATGFLTGNYTGFKIGVTVKY